MDYKEKATILRVCSSKEGERCSRCPAFGQGNRHCRRNAMRDASVAITDLLARAEAAEARAEKAERERDEYFAHLKGRCFCCVHKDGGFDCHVKCRGHRRGTAWEYGGPEKEE